LDDIAQIIGVVRHQRTKKFEAFQSFNCKHDMTGNNQPSRVLEENFQGVIAASNKTPYFVF